MRIDAEKKSREQNDLKNHFVTARDSGKSCVNSIKQTSLVKIMVEIIFIKEVFRHESTKGINQGIC